MQIEKGKNTVSVMLSTTKNLRELWAELKNQANITNERFKKINERLETVRAKLKRAL